MEGYVLNLGKQSVTYFFGKVSVPGLKPGDRVQLHPFLVKGQEIFVRRVERNQPQGKLISVNLKYLHLSEEQKATVESARKFLSDLLPTKIKKIRQSNVSSPCDEIKSEDRVLLCFQTIEASVGIKKKNNLRSFFFYFPITIMIIKGTVPAEICLAHLNDLSLNSEQKDKIKELLSNEIIELAKSLNFKVKELEDVSLRMDNLLKTIFVSEKEDFNSDQRALETAEAY